MVRILSIGTRLDYANYADWDEEPNIMDYDIVFVNLRDLERRKDEFIHAGVPEGYKRQYNFPPVEYITNLITTGGNVFIGLPSTLETMPSEDQNWEPPEPIPPDTPIPGGTPLLRFLSWLPFDIEVREQSGESIDEDTIHEDWDWYFQKSFSWDFSFPERSYDVDSVRFRVEPLVENRYGDCIATELVANLASGKRVTGLQPDWGSIYLLPLLDGWSMENLAYQILNRWYPNIDIETVGRRPEWLGKYSAPREEEIEERIESLQRELAKYRGFKDLLWDDGDELEEAVYEALQMADLDVEEEVENRRDGTIKLDDRVLVLEITGTRNNLNEGKPSQLNKWVANNQDEFDEEVTGLFVINHAKEDDPVDRQLQVNPDLLETLDNLDVQVVTGVELFRMVHGLESGSIDDEDVRERLQSDDTFIEFNEVEDPFQPS